jgi:hypothetical protein
MLRRPLLFAVFMAVPLCLPAQAPADTAAVEPGVRLRVTLDSGAPAHIIGVLVSQRPDSLWLRRGRGSTVLAVPRFRVIRLEVSQGRPSSWRLGAALGSLIGVGVGALIVRGKTYELGDNTPAVQFLASLGIGGLIGGIIGSGVRRDEWHVLARGGPEPHTP